MIYTIKKISFLSKAALLCTIFLFMLASAEAFSWKNVRIGGGGGYVPNIIYNQTQPGLVYAKTDMGGIYRRDSVSKVWIPLTDWVAPEKWNMLGGESFATDPVDPKICYFAAGTYTNDWTDMNGRILRSKDYGNTWEEFELPFKFGGNMPGRGMGERLAIDPNSHNVLYFGARSGNGLWKSTDYGETWKKITIPVTGDYIQDPEFTYTADPLGVVWVTFDKAGSVSGTPSNKIFIGVAQKNGPTIFESKDAGLTWSAIEGQPLGPDTNHLLPHHGVVSDSFLFVPYNNKGGPYDGGYGEVWKYNIRTNVWVDISPHNHLLDEAWGTNVLQKEDPYFGYGGFCVDPQNPNVLITATVNSWWPDAIMFKSVNCGASWTKSFVWTSYPSAKFKYVMNIAGTSGTYPWLNSGITTSNWPDVISIKLGHMISGIAINPFNSNELMYGTGGTIFGTQNFGNWGDSTKPLVNIKSVAEGIEECAILALAVPPVTSGAGSNVKLITGAGDIGGMTHTDLMTSTQMFQMPRFNRTTSIDYAELDPKSVVRVGLGAPDKYEDTMNLAQSNDGGLSWNKLYVLDKSYRDGSISISAKGSITLWAASGKIPSYGTVSGFKPTNLPADVQTASDRVNDSMFYAFKDSTFYSGSGTAFTASLVKLPVSSSKIKATPGFSNHVWIPAGKRGLWHTEDGGKTFSQVDSTVVQSADIIGFGKAAPGATYPATYITGKVSGKTGVFISKDKGATWIRINDDAHQYGSISYAITGDMRKYGIVFVGTNGRGVVYGDISGVNSVAHKRTVSSVKRIIWTGKNISVAGSENLNLFDLRGTLVRTGRSDGLHARVDLSGLGKGLYVAVCGRDVKTVVVRK